MHPVTTTRTMAHRLQSLLRDAGFTLDAIIRRLEITYRQWDNQDNHNYRKILKYRLSPAKDRLDVLIRLFYLNVSLERTQVGWCFSDSDIEGLMAMNLLCPASGDKLTSRLALFECNGMFIVTDSVAHKMSDINRVMALLPESYEFIGAVSRQPVAMTLDLCTGSGVHALAAASHSGHVTGTDISARAIRFARFNQWLNGMDNVSFCEADLTQPTDETTYDLIIANPPYMPVSDSTPGENFYCGGKQGDFLSSKIIGNLQRQLRPGGLCQLIHMMVSFGKENYEDRIRRQLGPHSSEYSIVVLSNPIEFRNDNTMDAVSVEFGVTNIYRHPSLAKPFFFQGAFDPPLDFDMAHLFAALARAETDAARHSVWQRYTQSEPMLARA